MTAPIRSPAYFFVNYYLNLLNHGKKIKTTWAEHGPETPGLKSGPTPALQLSKIVADGVKDRGYINSQTSS